jgi:hypothetical protein
MYIDGAFEECEKVQGFEICKSYAIVDEDRREKWSR